MPESLVSSSSINYSVIEGMAFIDTNIAANWTAMTGTTHVSAPSPGQPITGYEQVTAQQFDMDPNGKLNLPSSYDYKPSFSETQLQDTNDLLAQENMTFAFTMITGVSLVVLAYMVFNSQNSTPTPASP
jgi:hypothetical protein